MQSAHSPFFLALTFLIFIFIGEHLSKNWCGKKRISSSAHTLSRTADAAASSLVAKSLPRAPACPFAMSDHVPGIVPFKFMLNTKFKTGKFFNHLYLFMKSIKEADSPNASGATKQTYKSSKTSQRSPLHLVFDPHKCFVSFVYVYTCSSMHITFENSIVSKPDEVPSGGGVPAIRRVCIDHNSVNQIIDCYYTLCKGRKGQSKKDPIESVVFSVCDSDILTAFVDKSGRETCNMKNRLSASITEETYDLCRRRGMIPDHLLRREDAKCDDRPAPEWTAHIDFSRNTLFASQRNRRVVCFGVEIKVPRVGSSVSSDSSVFAIMNFVFDPDQVDDGSLLQFVAFAERVDVQTASIAKEYRLKIIEDEDSIPSSLMNVLKVHSRRSKKTRDTDSKSELLRALCSGMAQTESSQPNVAPPEPDGAQSDEESAIMTPTSIQDAIEMALKQATVQPRACLAFAGLYPPDVIACNSGSNSCTFTRRAGRRAGINGTEAIQSSESLSCVFKNRMVPMLGIVFVQHCESTFAVDKELSPVTLARAIEYRIKGWEPYTRKRVVRAIKRFLDNGGEFQTALKKPSKKRKRGLVPAS